MIISSIVGVIFCWLLVRNTNNDGENDDTSTENNNYTTTPHVGELTDCGSINLTWYQQLDYQEQYNVDVSLNEDWRNGTAVALLSVGAMVNAIIVFNILQNEISSELLGVLRALGLRDSVYWMSWYIPFSCIAFINSVLATIVFTLLPSSHVNETVYAGGLLWTLWFLQLALMGASFFLATVVSNKILANFVIVILIVAMWVPMITLSAQSSFPYTSNDPNTISVLPRGLFWQHVETVSLEWIYNDTSFDYDTVACNFPIMNQEQGTWLKTETERELVQDDEYFLGCYMASSWSTKVWNGEKKLTMLFMFLFPYFHFTNAWGNIVGFTSMPNRTFGPSEASLSSEELAIMAMPGSINPAWGGTSSMADQASTFILGALNFWDYDRNDLSTCPSGGNDTDFCSTMQTCQYAQNPGSIYGTPSVNESIGLMFALAVLFLLLAAYWAQVFPGKNGMGERFYFFLLPSYWCGNRNHRHGMDGELSNNDDCVMVQNVRKQYYKGFEALKGVSFTMNPGEVTSLLGRNGAGKSSLA